jgi:hypothetical protein
MLRHSRGVAAAATPVILDDRIGALLMAGSGETGTANFSYNSAAIVARAAENYTPTAKGSYLQLETTATGGTTRTERIRIQANGNVGIGTATPGQKLDVAGNIHSSGQLVSGSQVISGGTTAVDWNNGNVIRTDYNCGSSFAFANLQDGGTYTLIVTGTGTTQCNFSTTTTGTDAATVAYRFKPDNTTRTASSYTVYTLMRTGSVVLVSWATGF